MSDAQPPYLERLDEFPPYKGGHTCLYGGYVWEFCPGHRLQNKWGWVAQHRLVAEDILGRQLRQSRDPKIGEHVHHKDGDPTNNHPSNLEILTKSAHHSYESKKYLDAKYGHLTHDAAVEALNGRTIREAASHLGVTHMTLRRRCPQAVAPRKRVSPTDLSKPRNLAKLLELAADPNVCVHEATMRLRMAERTILKVCKSQGVRWVRKSKKGMLQRTYRGKPTQRALELHASGIDPESTRTRRLARAERRARLHQSAQEAGEIRDAALQE
jgi:hypothetical protein